MRNLPDRQVPHSAFLPQRIAYFARKILGLPHVISVHPGGIVIGRKPIDHYVPVQTAAKGVRIVQFDKNGVEDINLVKLDLLGNRNLSTIRYATDLIRRRRGVSIDIEALGADAATIRTLQAAQTIGCNQLESPAMRHLLRMMQPTGPQDVMKILALIRPGAASIGMKEVFIRRHRGLENCELRIAKCELPAPEECGMRNAECGIPAPHAQGEVDARRSLTSYDAERQADSHGQTDVDAGLPFSVVRTRNEHDSPIDAGKGDSAFRIPHSAFCSDVAILSDRALSPEDKVRWLLRGSYGVMLYEDDVMLVAAALLGKSLDEADRFRKAVQKCHDDAARLALSRQFLDACAANGVEATFARDMWVQMAKYNAYSFCRAHAASYAVLAYAGAYLKTHYPLEFWVACLNNNQSMYPPRCYIEEAKRQGVEFLLPCVNRSCEEYTLEDWIRDSGFGIREDEEKCGMRNAECGISTSNAQGNGDACRDRTSYNAERQAGANVAPDVDGGLPFSVVRTRNEHNSPTDVVQCDSAFRTPHSAFIRVGLGCVSGLGPVSVKKIIDERAGGGAFAGLSDFLSRTRMGREEARSLILCGAFDFTGRRRPALMLELELFLSSRMGRMGAGRTLLAVDPTVPVVPGDYEPLRKYMDERRILSMSVREHLMAIYRPLLAKDCGLGLDARAEKSKKAEPVLASAGDRMVGAAAVRWADQIDLIDSRGIESRVGRRVRLSGVLEAYRSNMTQKGERMLFLTMDDEFGLFEVTVFPDALRRLDGLFGDEPPYGPYVIEGTVEDQYGAITVSASRVELYQST